MTPTFCIDAAIDELGLPSRTVRVYLHLAAAAARGDGFPSYSSIGAVCFAPDLPRAKSETWRRMAIAAVKELVERGLVEKEVNRAVSGAPGVNRYRLTARSEWKAAEGGEIASPDAYAPLGECAPRDEYAPPADVSTPRHTSKRAACAGHPALEIYREVFALTPSPQQEQAIVETVKDCTRWREVLTTWAHKGYKPANVFDQLDVYRRGWREQTRSSREPNGARSDAGTDSWTSFVVAPIFEEAGSEVHS